MPKGVTQLVLAEYHPCMILSVSSIPMFTFSMHIIFSLFEDGSPGAYKPGLFLAESFLDPKQVRLRSNIGDGRRLCEMGKRRRGEHRGVGGVRSRAASPTGSIEVYPVVWG